MKSHKGLEWAKVQAKLDPPTGGEKLWSLNEMETTGGEYFSINKIRIRENAFPLN